MFTDFLLFHICYIQDNTEGTESKDRMKRQLAQPAWINNKKFGNQLKKPPSTQRRHMRADPCK